MDQAVLIQLEDIEMNQIWIGTSVATVLRHELRKDMCPAWAGRCDERGLERAMATGIVAEASTTADTGSRTLNLSFTKAVLYH